MKDLTVQLCEISIDGLPDMQALAGRVAFLWDGHIMTGYPLLDKDPHGHTWEGDSDFARPNGFAEITHYVIFPAPLAELGQSEIFPPLPF